MMIFHPLVWRVWKMKLKAWLYTIHIIKRTKPHSSQSFRSKRQNQKSKIFLMKLETNTCSQVKEKLEIMSHKFMIGIRNFCRHLLNLRLSYQSQTKTTRQLITFFQLELRLKMKPLVCMLQLYRPQIKLTSLVNTSLRQLS